MRHETCYPQPTCLDQTGEGVFKGDMKNLKIAVALGLAAFATACSNSTSFNKAATSKPVVQNFAVTNNGTKPGVNGTSQSVNVTLVVDKNALLGQEFLYGADLQYSDYHDPGFNLYNQSMAIGHIPGHIPHRGQRASIDRG